MLIFLFFLRINLTINVAHPVFLMHIQSLLSGYAPAVCPYFSNSSSVTQWCDMDGIVTCFYKMLYIVKVQDTDPQTCMNFFQLKIKYILNTK